MFESLRAEGLAEGIIWLILFVVWIFAQVVNRDKPKPGQQQKPRPGQAPQQPRRTTEDSLKDFLERLDEAMHPEAPASQPPPLPPQQVQRAPEPPRREVHATRRQRADHTHKNVAGLKAAHAEQKARLQARMSRMSDLLKSKTTTGRMQRYDLAEEEAPSSDFNFVSTVDTKSEIINFRSMMIDIDTVPVPSLSSAAPSSVHVDLRDRNDVKKAVIGRIVLGPPKALSPEQYDYGKPAM